jgi:hypothetical protein
LSWALLVVSIKSIDTLGHLAKTAHRRSRACQCRVNAASAITNHVLVGMPRVSRRTSKSSRQRGRGSYTTLPLIVSGHLMLSMEQRMVFTTVFTVSSTVEGTEARSIWSEIAQKLWST